MFSFIIVALIILVIVYIFYREYINKKDKSKPTKLEILQTSNILSDLVFIKDLIIKNLYDAGTLDYINDKHELTRKDFYATFLVNSNKPRDIQRQGILHELVHVIHDDMYNTANVDLIERMAHARQFDDVDGINFYTHII